MQSEKYIRETINIRTLTPVYIGGDQANNLSPITDYVVKNGRVFIVDQRKFENLLSKDNELIDEYVTLVKQGKGKFDLENFIENKLNSSVEELSKKEISVEGYIERGEIQSFISSNGNTFIPGSTVKGAIRTSFIYNYLTQTDEGKSLVKEIFNPQIALDKLKNKQNLRVKEKKTIKNLEELIRNMPNNKFNRNNKFAYNYIYNELLLFNNKITGNDFRHIQISDSNSINDEDTKIVQIYRRYLIKDSIKTSPLLHVMKENSKTNFDIKLVNDFKDDFLKQLNNRDIKDLFKMINQFSIDFIEFELERFEEFIKNAKTAKKAIAETLQGTITFYNELKEKIKAARNSVAVLRIGGGKTYFDNSIGLALFKKDKDKFKQFRKLLGIWKHSGGWKAPFVEEDSPITRSFYYDRSLDSNLPLGWTVLYLEKDKDDVNKLFGYETENKKGIKNINYNEKSKSDNEELDLSKLSNLGRVTTKRKN